jgi:hypothetical protein
MRLATRSVPAGAVAAFAAVLLAADHVASKMIILITLNQLLLTLISISLAMGE